ncbi:MAG: ABC transporter permease [Treponema sp.]
MIFLKTKLLDFYPLYILSKKELKSVFFSPIFPLLLVITIIGHSLSLVGNNYWLSSGISDFKNYFLSIPLLFSITIPMLTMSIWADEKKQNTDMILLSMPISERFLVYAKYFSCFFACIFMSILTLIPPFTLLDLVEFSPFTFFMSYLSTVIFASSLLSISLAISFASKHAPVNFIISFLLIIFFNIIHIPASFLKIESLKSLLFYLSFSYHIENASKGIFDSRDIFFYLALLIFGIELNIFIIKLKVSLK